MFIKKPEIVDVEPVRIKPLFGMKPGLWLSVLYLIIIVTVLFLVGILPDLISASKRVTFKSEVYNCAVFVDGNYKGATPITVKTDSGVHEIVYSINGVELDRFEIRVGHPVFFAWLFPRHQTVYSDKVLNEQAYNSLVKEFFQDLVNYSAVLEYDDVYLYPPLFSDFVKTVSSYSNFDKDILITALSFITTNEMLEDAESAFAILGLEYDFSKIKSSIPVKTFESFSSIPEKDVKLGRIDSIETFDITGYLIDCSQPFFIGENEVSEALYHLFLNENPYWHKDNIEKLISDGLADENYLSNFSSNIGSLRAVRNVTYYSALAFCKWLSEKTGKDVFLPSVEQWRDAYKVSDHSFHSTLISYKSSGKPASMLGGVWEITSSSYVPSKEAEILTEKLGVKTEVVVTGGSYLNSSSAISENTIGIISKDMSSDFIGFRIAWR